MSERYFTDLSLTYLPIPTDSPVAYCLQSLGAEARRLGAKHQTLARLNPGQSAIVLLSVYDRDDEGFEERFLDEGILHKEVAFKIDGRSQAIAVRSLRRKQALVVSLPFGWYEQ